VDPLALIYATADRERMRIANARWLGSISETDTWPNSWTDCR